VSFFYIYDRKGAAYNPENGSNFVNLPMVMGENKSILIFNGTFEDELYTSLLAYS
jgi:hypothetical protein